MFMCEYALSGQNACLLVSSYFLTESTKQWGETPSSVCWWKTRGAANDCVGLQNKSFLRKKENKTIQPQPLNWQHSLIDWIILGYGDEWDKGATSYRFLYIYDMRQNTLMTLTQSCIIDDKEKFKRLQKVSHYPEPWEREWLNSSWTATCRDGWLFILVAS